MCAHGLALRLYDVPKSGSDFYNRNIHVIIDSHQHVFWHNRNDVDLVADMDASKIDKAWLLSWEIPVDQDARGYHAVLNPLHIRENGTHAGIPFSDLVLARDRYPERFILGYCPYPLAGDAPGLFEAAYDMYGVRVCGEWKFRIPFDDPRCLNLFRAAGRLGCPVVLHLDVPYLTNDQGESVYLDNWYGGTIDNLQRALDACPDTNFIGHAPGFWREISGDSNTAGMNYPKGKVTQGGKITKLMRQYSNLYADLSAGSGLTAMKRDPEHALTFMTEFSDRLLFARDYYGGELQAFIDSLALTDDVRQRIMCDNALGLVHDQAPAGRKPTRKLWSPPAAK